MFELLDLLFVSFDQPIVFLEIVAKIASFISFTLSSIFSWLTFVESRCV